MLSPSTLALPLIRIHLCLLHSKFSLFDFQDRIRCLWFCFYSRSCYLQDENWPQKASKSPLSIKQTCPGGFSHPNSHFCCSGQPRANDLLTGEYLILMPLSPAREQLGSPWFSLHSRMKPVSSWNHIHPCLSCFLPCRSFIHALLLGNFPLISCSHRLLSSSSLSRESCL